MATFYITQGGGVLRYLNSCFVAERPGRDPVAAPEFKVDRIVAFGMVHVTQPAASRLFQRKAEMHFLTRRGRYRGRLTPADDPRVDVRLNQYRGFDDEDRRLEFARLVVEAKIGNCRKLLMRHRRNHPETALGEWIGTLGKARREAAACPSIALLRGLEGAAAEDYFRALERIVGDGALFGGRSRRPPADPVNAILSLLYTLVGIEIAGELAARALDPYLGYYHQPRRGNPALAQDILEEFRAPIADRLALAMFNRHELTADDFHGGSRGGVQLTEKGMRRFLESYETELNEPFAERYVGTITWRKALGRQATRFRRYVDGKEPYEAFRWDRA